MTNKQQEGALASFKRSDILLEEKSQKGWQWLSEWQDSGSFYMVTFEFLLSNEQSNAMKYTERRWEETNILVYLQMNLLQLISRHIFFIYILSSSFTK